MVETTLTNPGIIDRLEQDITDYLSPFGFSIERQEIDKTVSSNANNKCNNKSKCRAVLTSPSLPEDGPIYTLHLHIYNESLIPTIGPLLRTYLRLSSPSISPLKLRSILYCNFTLDPIPKYTKMNTTQQSQVLKQQEELSAKKVIQYIHMIIRNSMGAACCIDVMVVLPCYWRRVDSTTDESSRSRVSMSTESVRHAMQNNPDACYPSVQLVQQSENNIRRDDDTCLHLDVKTRMCTVRHQPLLFRWISTLDGSITNDQHDASTTEIQSQPHDRQATPLIVACIEKVANLHRILMLLYDYDQIKEDVDKSSSLYSKVVIILPNDIERDKTLSEFNDAIDNFHKVIIDEQESHGRMYRPTLVYVDQASEKISSMKDTPTFDQSSIIGIDLHPEALTLKGDYRRHPSPALQQMKDADAIVFGYESTGIPEVVSKLLNSWVQIPSRSSINVVAAMSIILDALMDNKV